MRSFLEGLPTGAVVADVGCGNGKYFGVRSDIMVLGSDRSSGLARVAALRLQGPTFPATGVRCLTRLMGDHVMLPAPRPWIWPAPPTAHRACRLQSFEAVFHHLFLHPFKQQLACDDPMPLQAASYGLMWL